MDAIRTLLLARTHVVVLDPDVAASAATRPSRDVDVERFEDELASLGFVMSLDLAITIRRLPNQAIHELRTWIVSVVSAEMRDRPRVPIVRGERAVMRWLATRAEQPCPWCGERKVVHALDPCAHLVCKTCWEGGSFAGCPVCHRRAALAAPATGEPVTGGDGHLRLLHLAFDLLGTARARFEALMARGEGLAGADRAEVEAIIDTLGPRAVQWLPKRIAARETMAIAVARLWMISPDRHAILRATAEHLKTATDVLRVAIVLMGGDPALAAARRLGPIARRLRTCVLEALDRLPPEALVEDVRRHAALWKRAGERLHPFEQAARFPTAALAFAVVRGTSVTGATFSPTLRAQVDQHGSLRIDDDRVRVTGRAAKIEGGLRAGDARAVAELLAPAELLARADQLLRVAHARQPDAASAVVRSVQHALPRGEPARLLALSTRVPLLTDAVRVELLVRAEARRHYARAVIDRALPPPLWELACLHATARANLVYVREASHAVAQYRRRDGESALTRLARISAAAGDDSVRSSIPPAEAPTWFAVVRDDLVLPRGSIGFAAERRDKHHEGVTFIQAANLVAELASR